MKKYSLLLSALCWIMPTFTMAPSAFNTLLQETMHFGYICTNFLQTADAIPEELLSDQQKNCVQLIKGYKESIQKIILAQQSGKSQKDAVVAFGNDILAIADTLALRTRFYQSFPTELIGTDYNGHAATIQSAINALDTHLNTLFKKSIHARIADKFAYNYITTYFIPNTIQYVISPATSLLLAAKSMKPITLSRNRDHIRISGTGVACIAATPIVLGYGLARLLKYAQEEQFLRNQDRAYDQQALLKMQQAVVLNYPSYLTYEQRDNTLVAHNTQIKNTLTFMQDPADWWKQKNPGPQMIILAGPEQNTRNAATSIAHNANMPIISCSFLELSSAEFITAVVNKAKEYADGTKAIIIGIEDIDCLPANSQGAQNVLNMIQENPYLNMLIVATAQYSAAIPHELDGRYDLIRV